MLGTFIEEYCVFRSLLCMVLCLLPAVMFAEGGSEKSGKTIRFGANIPSKNAKSGCAYTLCATAFPNITASPLIFPQFIGSGAVGTG